MHTETGYLSVKLPVSTSSTMDHGIVHLRNSGQLDNEQRTIYGLMNVSVACSDIHGPLLMLAGFCQDYHDHMGNDKQHKQLSAVRLIGVQPRSSGIKCPIGFCCVIVTLPSWAAIPRCAQGQQVDTA
jgi:hypothetical protein